MRLQRLVGNFEDDVFANLTCNLPNLRRTALKRVFCFSSDGVPPESRGRFQRQRLDQLGRLLGGAVLRQMRGQRGLRRLDIQYL